MASGDDVVTTIVSAEEQLRGWLGQIHRLGDDVVNQVTVYDRLRGRLEFYSNWILLPWTSEASDLFKQLRKDGVRIGAMDLKIACITLSNRATLLTRNTVDFAKVPGLSFEDWLD